jgi:hypothetical protein
MSTFVVLHKWTDKSFEAMNDPGVGEEIKKIVKEMGAALRAGTC